jgi:hypothetical protein
MKRATFTQQLAVCLAVIGFCFPQAAVAATGPNKRAPVVTDIQLRQGGVLLGQVVTPENVGIPGKSVSLRSGQQKIAVGKTDKNGYFAFSGLRRGVYQVAAAKGYGMYRVWDQRSAPPAAQPGALIVAGHETVRGQYGMQTFRNLLSNPLVIAGIVATAIAVPVAIHNAKRSEGSP